MRDAANEAKMTGLQLAANPPEPQEQEDQDEQGPPQNAKAQKGSPGASRGGNSKDATSTAKGRAPQSRSTGDHREDRAISTDYRNWRARAVEDVKQGRTQRRFNSILIPEYVQAYLHFELERCLTADDVRDLFKRVEVHQMEVVGQ
jgi:hypothetical protein